jgi:hypothetical protein
MKSHTHKTEAGRLESPAYDSARLIGYVRVMELPNGLGGVDLAVYDDEAGRKAMSDPDFTPIGVCECTKGLEGTILGAGGFGLAECQKCEGSGRA